MIRIGVIGLGYWGPNLVRCFSENSDCDVAFVCDRDSKRLDAVNRRFPSVVPTTDVEHLLRPGAVDAVVIATPTRAHFDLASRALAAGIHTFVEKPLASSREECRELISLAEENERVLFVGHVFLHSAPVAKLRELVLSGELGDLYYICSNRLNLGPVRQDVNALWDLAPHDLSIILDLIGQSPEKVSCCGLAYLNPQVHDVCNLTIHFPENRIGILHVSWLDPRKNRVMTVVGSKKMAVYDDLEPNEKIKIYDIGVETLPFASTFGEFQFSYRYGDTYSPRLNQVEPLRAECDDFIRCIRDGVQPKTNGTNGLRVVEILEAASLSLARNGVQVDVETGTELGEPADLATTRSQLLTA
jgi:predicted dehydrogenase